jgi:cytochrome c oxidase accessory protein FixG
MSAQQPVTKIDIVEVEGFAPIDLYQRREKIFNRYVGGFYQRLRFFTGWPLLIGYFLTPWLNWEGRQAVLFDLPARQFHILSLTYWPEDLWLLGWILIIAAFGLFTVTTVVGRLWCGYTCPQTVWTAMFMWVEQITEGSRNQRIKLDAAPWSIAKLGKRGTKHILWLGIAALTGLAFVGYFAPIREMVQWQPQMLGWAHFWLAFFTVATYINAGWLREQVCIYMCPYARFQSAMVDEDTLVVSYDPKRGEPRGLQKQSTARLAVAQAGALPQALGDCVDCSLCVQVCPTGIDIRDGLQYECIGCAHCIDACNQVMAKVGRKSGLIRYTTLHALQGGLNHWLRPRSIGYAVVTLIMMALLTTAIVARDTLSIAVTRDRASLFTELSDGRVRNDYSVKVTNKSGQPLSYELLLSKAIGLTLGAYTPVVLAPRSDEILTLSLFAAADGGSSLSTEFDLQVCARPVPQASSEVADKIQCVSEPTRFFLPAGALMGSGR